MREPARDPGRLEHILMAIANIEEFTCNIDYNQFVADKKTLFATTYNIQIIGEAAYKLTKEFRAAHDDVDWLLMEKMRHIIVHGYYKVNPIIIWNVATDDIIKVKPQIQRLFDQYNKNGKTNQ